MTMCVFAEASAVTRPVSPCCGGRPGCFDSSWRACLLAPSLMRAASCVVGRGFFLAVRSAWLLLPAPAILQDGQCYLGGTHARNMHGCVLGWVCDYHPTFRPRSVVGGSQPGSRQLLYYVGLHKCLLLAACEWAAV